MRRKEGSHGYEGGIPCAQTNGLKKFYKEGQTPHKLMENDEYRDITVMFGSNSHEGSYVYGGQDIV